MIPTLITTGMMVPKEITGRITMVTMMMGTDSEKIRMSLLVAVVVTGIPT